MGSSAELNVESSALEPTHHCFARRLVAEGAGEDESADNAFRVFAVNTYLKAWIDFLKLEGERDLC